MITSQINDIQITRRVLDELWLHVSSRCNLVCEHCLFACSPNQNEPGTLTLDECKTYINQSLNQGVKAIYITGGEPMLWPYLLDFLSWYYSLDNKVHLTILTNGTLITSKLATEFSKYTPQNLTLRISLECYTTETHEQYRGIGSFTKALQGIKYLNSVSIKPWIAYVNKSGGNIDPIQVKSLEDEFHQRLFEEHSIEIAGLKVIGAYSKGRFAEKPIPTICAQQVNDRKESVQCTYGVAISKLGITPCPILVDKPEAVLNNSFSELIGDTFSINYNFCTSCFATGTSCGQ